MRKGTRFCKKSLKLYLWIKQMKNSILINIRWRPQVLGYIRDINKKSFMSLVTFTFWGLQDRDLWLILLLFLFHNGLLIGLTMGYLLLKAGKLTAGQKKLSKVDKSGMKSLASFFSPKAKSWCHKLHSAIYIRVIYLI